MIAIFNDSGSRLTVAYNGLSMNVAADNNDDTYEINSVVTGDAYTVLHDDRPNDDGSELSSAVRKTMKIIRIDGTIRAPSVAKFMDKRQALAVAFDAAKIARENSSDPYLPLTFSVPTTDTVTYATGLISSKYLVLPKRLTLPAISQYTGESGFFSVELEAIDPRRYYATLQSTTAIVGSGSQVYANTKANTDSPGTLTITMSGAGSATYTVYDDSLGLTHLVLNLSTLTNGQYVTVDMKSKSISLSGTAAPQLYVSGDFWNIPPDDYLSAGLVVTNGTNASTVMSWYPAFVD